VSLFAAGLKIMAKTRRLIPAAKTTIPALVRARRNPPTSSSDTTSGIQRKICAKYHHRCSMNERPVTSGKKPRARRTSPTVAKANPFRSLRATRYRMPTRLKVKKRNMPMLLKTCSEAGTSPGYASMIAGLLTK